VRSLDRSRLHHLKRASRGRIAKIVRLLRPVACRGSEQRCASGGSLSNRDTKDKRGHQHDNEETKQKTVSSAQVGVASAKRRFATTLGESVLIQARMDHWLIPKRPGSQSVRSMGACGSGSLPRRLRRPALQHGTLNMTVIQEKGKKTTRGERRQKRQPAKQGVFRKAGGPDGNAVPG